MLLITETEYELTLSIQGRLHCFVRKVIGQGIKEHMNCIFFYKGHIAFLRIFFFQIYNTNFFNFDCLMKQACRSSVELFSRCDHSQLLQYPTYMYIYTSLIIVCHNGQAAKLIYLHYAATNYPNYQVTSDNHILKVLTRFLIKIMLPSIPLKTL